jgi:transglutaminase-like putative cysteine protease
MTCQCHNQNPHDVALISIPDGAEGTREVLKTMRDQVRAAKLDPAFRELAFSILWAAGVWEKNFRGEVLALFAWVRSRIRYTLDTNDVEVVQSPRVTLSLRFGDCDDVCTLLAALCESVGHPCAFAALGFDDDPDDFTHVVVLAYPGAGDDPIALDVTEPCEAGWFPPNPTSVLLAPI